MSFARLELDYIHTPRGLRWGGVLLLAAALAVAALLFMHYRQSQRDLNALLAAQGLSPLVQRPASANARARLDEQSKQMQDVMRELNLPWGPMIDALEHASTDNVALLQLQPDVQQHVLRVTAEAKTRQAMIDYLHRLADSKAFAEVHLVSHRVAPDDPSHPVEFIAQALFRTP